MATTYVFANNVNTTLAAAATNTDTTLQLASSTNLPLLTTGQIMPLTLNDAATGNIYEIVYVTAISGTSLTVIRAQEGTGAQNWSIGDYAFSDNTAGTTAASLVPNATPGTQEILPIAQADARYAALAGLSTQIFSAAPGTTGDEVVNFSQFPQNLGASGYQKFPGGLTIQWGHTGSIGAGGAINVTFPIAFPAACVYANTVQDTQTATAASNAFVTLSASGFSSVNTAGASTGFYWFALGY